MMRSFRLVGYLEGLSLLVLLGIAMPLKYVFSNPEGVRVVGWIHGLLFILYVALLALVSSEQKWSGRRVAQALIASVLPFGTFAFDKVIRDSVPS